MGTTLSSILCRKDPSSKHCKGQNCLPCPTQPTRRMRSGVLYVFKYKICMKAGKEGNEAGTHVGESAKTEFDRGQIKK